MVRYVWIGTMLAILCIVLYIPSASPPARFTEVLRAEHAVTRDIWGPAVADRILRRMLDIQQGSLPLSGPPIRQRPERWPPPAGALVRG